MVLTIGMLFNQQFYEPEDDFKVHTGEKLCFIETEYELNCKHNFMDQAKRQTNYLKHSQKCFDVHVWANFCPTVAEFWIIFFHLGKNLLHTAATECYFKRGTVQQRQEIEQKQV